jgi:hypothetical protein
LRSDQSCPYRHSPYAGHKQIPLLTKTDFSSRINSIHPVQPSRKKYRASTSAQISFICRASRLMKRGVSRSSRTWRREAVAARHRSIRFRMRTNEVLRTAKPCGPGAPTLASNSRRRVPRLAGDGGNKARSPGRARSKPLKPLRGEGRVRLGLTCGSCPVHFFHARGPRVPAGIRPSLRPHLRVALRPLIEEGHRTKQSSGNTGRENAASCLVQHEISVRLFDNRNGDCADQERSAG